MIYRLDVNTETEEINLLKRKGFVTSGRERLPLWVFVTAFEPPHDEQLFDLIKRATKRRRKEKRDEL